MPWIEEKLPDGGARHIFQPEPTKGRTLGDIDAWGIGDNKVVTYTGPAHPASLTSPHNLLLSHRDPETGKESALSVLHMGHEGRIESVETHPNHRRQGYASALLNTAKELSEEYDNFPEPKHSNMRTSSGNAWAVANGAERIAPNVSATQFREHRWA